MRRVGIHQIQNPQSIFDCGKAFGVPAAPVGRTTAAHGERGNRVVPDLGLTVDPVRHREGRGGRGARGGLQSSRHRATLHMRLRTGGGSWRHR